jgi:multiple sugar transport system permease protein
MAVPAEVQAAAPPALGLPRVDPAERRRMRRRIKRRRLATVLLFMAPWIVGFFAFILYPMLSSLYFSFTKYDLLKTPQWAGLFNYRFMFTKDPQFWQAMKNTLWIIAVGIPTRIVFAIFTAALLTKRSRSIGVYRTVFFLPSMAPAVAATLGFVYLLNPATGPVNQLLGLLHLPKPLWFFDPTWSKPGLVLLGLWGVGDAMIIFLAGLLNVPVQLYEAADVEGAARWQKFRYITLPMISPVIFFSLVIGVIDGFQYFTQAYVAAGAISGPGQINFVGSPQGSTMFYSVYLFSQGFQEFHMGYASAMAWVLFAVTMACTIVIIRFSRRWVHYQGGFR